MHQLALRLAIIAIVLGPASVAALDPRRSISQYGLRIWTPTTGLPTEAVSRLQQSPRGPLWIGTGRGPIRFDGLAFVEGYTRESAAHLASLDVTALLPTEDGVLWVGTQSGGLQHLDNGRVRVHSSTDGLLSDTVLALARGADGALWISTPDGLTRKEGELLAHYLQKEGDVAWAPSRGLAIDGPVVWVGTARGLVQLSHPKGLLRHWTKEDGLPGSEVRALLKSKDGALWVGTDAGAVLLRDGRFEVPPALTSTALSSSEIRRMVEDPDGNIWFAAGAWGSGLGLFRYDGTRVSSFTEREGLPSGDILDLAIDREGSLWATLDSGALVQLRDTELLPFGAPEGLRGTTGAVLRAQDNSLWIGTLDEGLYRLSGTELVHFHEKDTGKVILGLYEDAEQTLWVGSTTGIACFQRGRWSRPWPDRADLAGRRVFAFLRDTTGRLWIGTQPGLFVVESDGVPRELPATEYPFAHRSTRSFIEAPDGTVWIASLGGVARFTGGKFDVPDAIGARAAYPMVRADNGGLWLGGDFGLVHWTEGKERLLTQADGLIENSVYAIVDDRRGSIWLSGSLGLSRLDKGQLSDWLSGRRAKVTPTLYDASRGMRARDATGGLVPPAAVLADERIAFPTSRGLVFVVPGHEVKNRLAPVVALERFAANQEPSFLATATRLPPGSNPVEFRFSAASFRAADRVQFRFRLVGVDPEFSPPTTERVARYTNLAPGPYAFHVVAANEDGVWSKDEALVTFYLEPYFYQTRWFLAACVLSVVGLSFSGYRLRVRQLRARQRVLERLVTERTQELADANDTQKRNLAALLQVSLASSSAIEPAEQARATLDELVRLVGAERAFLFRLSEDGTRPVFHAGRGANAVDLVAAAGHAADLVTRAMRGGEAVLRGSTPIEEGTTLASAAAIPLLVHERLVGVVYLDNRVAPGNYGEKNARILLAIAHQIAIALETARSARLEVEKTALAKEIELSAAVQSYFLPRESHAVVDGCELAASYRPAHLAGGDWWWYEHRHQRPLRLLLGDVTGHGAASAMMTAGVASAYWTSMEHNGSQSTEELLGRIGGQLERFGHSKFLMTLVAVELSADDGKVRLWNAGGPGVLLLTPAGEVDVMLVPGQPLGQGPVTAGFEERLLERGTRVLLFSDGIVEMELASGRALGLRRFGKLVAATRQLGVKAAVAKIDTELQALLADRQQADDITMVMVEYGGAPKAPSGDPVLQ